jgi:hypothetical protein
MKNESRTAVQLYLILIVSIVLGFIPHVVIGTVSLFLFCGVQIVAYSLRRKAENGGLLDNHCTHLIRTIWVGSGIAAVTTAIGAAIMIPKLDYTPMDSCIEQTVQAAMSGVTHIGDLELLLRPCIHSFIETNHQPLILGAVVAIAPIVLYFMARLAEGLGKALRGQKTGKIVDETPA